MTENNFQIATFTTGFSLFQDFLVKYFPIRPELSEMNLDDDNNYVVHVFNNRTLGFTGEGPSKCVQIKNAIHQFLLVDADYLLVYIDDITVMCLYLLAAKKHILDYRKSLLKETETILPFIDIYKTILATGGKNAIINFPNSSGKDISLSNIFEDQIAALSFLNSIFYKITPGIVKDLVSKIVNQNNLKVEDFLRLEADFELLTENFSLHIENRGALMLAEYLQKTNLISTHKANRINSKSIRIILGLYKILGFTPDVEVDINRIKAFRERIRKAINSSKKRISFS